MPSIDADEACTTCRALQQGTVQGALYASASLGQAVGPLLIGNWLFVAFTRREGEPPTRLTLSSHLSDPSII